MDIIVKKTANGWKAYLSDNPKISESGKTEAEALGKLVKCASDYLGITILEG